MTPSHPGEFVRAEVVEELGLSVSRAARILDVRRATLSDLLNGKAGLSPEMALRLEKAFGVDMDLLLRMQGLARHLPNACTGQRTGGATVRAGMNVNWTLLFVTLSVLNFG